MSPEVLAALIAFAAAFLAVGAFWNNDTSRRRTLRVKKGKRLDQDGRGIEGPPMRQWLASAGFHQQSAAMYYVAITTMLTLLGATLGVLAASWAELGMWAVLSMGAGSALVFSRFPGSWVDSCWIRRKQHIEASMPLMLDMMDVCSTAGMAVDDSWSTIEKQLRTVCPPLAEEMELVALETKLGKSREQALCHMAERTGVVDASVLASMLTQSERFGSGLAETFRAQSTSMREEALRAMEERGARATVTMIMPIALLMLPAFVLVGVVAPFLVVIRVFSREL